ncbi:hypothetical protein STAQ_18150 [Allostella sp. ATCC 35155]|nr:hypothetical protein STAQ_18150 [Stella sp. ATCC 35155]
MNLAAVRDRLAGSDLIGFRSTQSSSADAKVGKAQQGKSNVGKMRGAKAGMIPNAKVGKRQGAMVGKRVPQARAHD